MGLSLVVGPAHVGKVALLLERYLAVLEHDPWLVVPNRVDVDRVERDLVRRRPALLAGTVGTFDDLFRHVAGAGGDEVPVASEIQRTLAVRRAVERVQLGELSSSAATAGFADTLLQAIGELESGLVDASQLDGDLPVLAAAYREELEALGLQDRDGLRRHAVERLRGDLDAWSGEPVFAYGFEDLTGAEWALLEALSARADVTVSIPYEPGRAAFEALERTVDDLAGLARGAIEELPRASASGRPAALAQLERELFSDEPEPGPPLDGAIRFLEGAGTRGTVELLASELGGASAWRDGSRARRSRLRVRRSLARTARERARRSSACPTRSSTDDASSMRRSAMRWPPCSDTPGSEAVAAISSPSCAHRSRASNVGRWTSSKDAFGAGPSPILLASTRRANACAARPSRRSSSSEQRKIPSQPPVVSSR